MAVRRHAWQSHIVVMLLLSEHKELITAAVLPSERIDAVSVFKIGNSIDGDDSTVDMSGYPPTRYHSKELPDTRLHDNRIESLQNVRRRRPPP